MAFIRVQGAKKKNAINAYFFVQSAVRSSELFARVGAAVCSSYEVFYHQAHVNDRKTITCRKGSLPTNIYEHDK